MRSVHFPGSAATHPGLRRKLQPCSYCPGRKAVIQQLYTVSQLNVCFESLDWIEIENWLISSILPVDFMTRVGSNTCWTMCRLYISFFSICSHYSQIGLGQTFRPRNTRDQAIHCRYLILTHTHMDKLYPPRGRFNPKFWLVVSPYVFLSYCDPWVNSHVLVDSKPFLTGEHFILVG